MPIAKSTPKSGNTGHDLANAAESEGLARGQERIARIMG